MLRSIKDGITDAQTWVDVTSMALANAAFFLITLIPGVVNVLAIWHFEVASHDESESFEDSLYDKYFGILADPEEKTSMLAAIGLSNTVPNRLGMSVGFGFCGALDVLVSHNHGAGRYEICVEHLLRVRALLTLSCLVVQ